ncbi:MAG: hypothetical protein LAN63_10225 [Acidobacteriia bacterium]|nr:hypothetical protein [Terriglobia bacterium]
MGNVWLGTRHQKIAACTVLLMVALGLFHSGREFDLPHLHSEAPIMPTTAVSIFASGNSTATISTLSWPQIR